MEASSIRAARLKGPAPQSRASEFAGNLVAPLRGALYEAGEIGAFGGRAILEMRGVWQYASEVMRQLGILIVGSAAIVIFMEFMMGVECGVEANYVLRGYGATIYSGVFTSYCNIRECIPYMWGYIFSAKVGCGLAAELGAMRIQDELDAMESMGLNPMRYVVATRLLAAWLFFPPIFIVMTGAHMFGSFVVLIWQIGEVSQGGWENVHWSFSTPLDIFYSFLKIFTTGTAIVILGMFYGYRASGGPVGVGTATAKSMILNLILVHVLGASLTMLFWGLTPNAPVGG